MNPLPSDQIGDMVPLVADLNAARWLVILNSNPIYAAPADLGFAGAFNKAKIVAHLGSHLDETGQIGTSIRRIILSPGRMRVRMTARSRLCSR